MNEVFSPMNVWKERLKILRSSFVLKILKYEKVRMALPVPIEFPKNCPEK